MPDVAQLWGLVKTPLERLITFVGGSGGLLYYVGLIRNRPRFSVRILHEVAAPGAPRLLLIFEAQNLGQLAMSLEPTIEFAGLDVTGVVRRWHPVPFTLLYNRPEERTLPPHTPRTLEAAAEVDAAFDALWYRTYTFRASRGGRQRIYLRHIKGQPLPWWRYQVETRLYRWHRTRDFLLRRLARGR